MNSLLVVDFSNLFFRGMFVNRWLSYQGTPTGGVYGFIGQLCRVIADRKPTSILICCDSKPYKRAEVCTEYKADRDESFGNDQEMVKAISINKKLCFSFLEDSGIPVWSIKGYEADDLLYSAVHQYRNLFGEIIVQSNDSDLYQMFEIGGRAELFFSASSGKKISLYTREAFVEEKGCLPEQWPWVTALSGSHNGVKGIKGVGEKTAIKIVTQGRLDEYKKKYPEVVQNYRVCRLPYDLWVLRQKPPSIKPHFSYRQATKVLSRCGIKTTDVMDYAFELLSEMKYGTK